jgi:hypothetical protein
MYQHTQRSPALFAVSCVGALLPIVLLFTPALGAAPLGARLVLGLTAVLMLILAFSFASFTVAVRDGQLSWWFGSGFVKKTVPLTSIGSAEPTTTTLMEGWGIHLTMRGWLYNIAGRKAVLVRRRDGRTFLLGTDEPERLAAVILEGARKR